MRPLKDFCSEQASESRCQSIHPLEKGIKAMSEQKPRYMQQLDEWTSKNVIEPIVDALREYQNMLDQDEQEPEREYLTACEAVMKAIREKVLQSYRNGQKAGPPRTQRFQNKQQQ